MKMIEALNEEIQECEEILKEIQENTNSTRKCIKLFET